MLKQNFWKGAPYPDDYPVVISWDLDMGWIVEDLNEGEYEVQNNLDIHYAQQEGKKVETPDFELAIKLAIERGVRVKYFHKWK